MDIIIHGGPCYPYHLVVLSPSYPHQKVVLIKPTLNQIKSTCHHYLLGGRLLSKLPVQHFQMNGLFSDSKFPPISVKKEKLHYRLFAGNSTKEILFSEGKKNFPNMPKGVGLSQIL